LGIIASSGEFVESRHTDQQGENQDKVLLEGHHSPLYGTSRRARAKRVSRARALQRVRF
jgi:hypothetical protein